MDEDKTPNPEQNAANSVEELATPPISTEEQILQSASIGVEEATKGPEPRRFVTSSGKPKKSRKKLYLVLLVILIAGATAAYFVSNKDSSPETKSTTQTKKTTTETASIGYQPNNVAYAYRGGTSEPFSMYYRPAAGGERKEAAKLQRDEFIQNSDTFGSLAVYSIGGSIYLSKDGGVSYKKIYTDSGADNYSGVVISRDATRIVFASVDSTTNKPDIINSVNLDGKDLNEVVKEDGQSLIPLAYHAAKNKLVYLKASCYACEANSIVFKMYDIGSKSSKEIPSSEKIFTVQNFQISDDFSKIIYVESTVDKNAKGNGIDGQYIGPPYIIKTMSVSDYKSDEIKTIGQKNEKNPNGTPKTRDFFVGFFAGTAVPYYAEGSSVYKISGQSASLVYSDDSPIFGVHFIDDKNIILESGSTPQDFILSNYDLATKKSTEIFSGDSNTVILGITTK